MKYYQIVEVDTQTNEEWEMWHGTHCIDAVLTNEKEIAKINFDKYHTSKEKSHRTLEFRVYEIPDDTDLTDKMEIAEALCECGGYDDF